MSELTRFFAADADADAAAVSMSFTYTSRVNVPKSSRYFGFEVALLGKYKHSLQTMYVLYTIDVHSCVCK